MKRVLALLVVVFALGTQTAVASTSQLRYQGTGTKLLRPISLPHGAHMRFATNMRNGASLFMLIDMKGDLGQLLVSKAQRGSTYIPPGRYTFKIGTWSEEMWVMLITPIL